MRAASFWFVARNPPSLPNAFAARRIDSVNSMRRIVSDGSLSV